jgi:hypothetical protein
MEASMLITEQDANQSVIVLGLTPPYLAPLSHEALYEIDLGVLKSESDGASEPLADHSASWPIEWRVGRTIARSAES